MLKLKVTGKVPTISVDKETKFYLYLLNFSFKIKKYNLSRKKKFQIDKIWNVRLMVVKCS